MTLLIGINFNREHRPCNINCVPADDKYLVAGRNCAHAELALATRSCFVPVVLVNTVGLSSKRRGHCVSPVVYNTNGKESGY